MRRHRSGRRSDVAAALDPSVPDRRALLRAFGVLGLLAAGAGAGWRRPQHSDTGPRRGTDIRLVDNGMMNMGRYRELFLRHNEIRRTVTDIPGGVRATTESDSPDLAAQLKAHVSDVYSRLDRGVGVMGAATSATLPVLVRNAGNYRRRLILTPQGVTVEETSADPALVQVIRDHAREVTGFVTDGMPEGLQASMGGMGPGGMGPGGHGGMGTGGHGGMGHP